MSEEQEFTNPIDKDKITETPGTLPYAHHAGSSVVKPEDSGKLKGRALNAMEHQTDMQLQQIYEQMALLAEQAKKLQHRKHISEQIYTAEMRFEPLINHCYYLYYRPEGTQMMSLISPEHWSASKPGFTFIAEVRLLADHTWDILRKNEELDW